MPKIESEIIKCAYCGKESEQHIVYSSSSFGNMDLDTRPPMSNMTLQYEVQECPYCHYCKDSINNIEYTPKTFSSEYEALVSDISISKTAKKFLLTALLYADCKDNFNAGMNFLKAAWIFDDQGNSECAINARKKAAVYLRRHVDDSSDGEIAIMLIDVLRRAEDFKAATELIAIIGDTGYDFYNNIIKYEQYLIDNKDSCCHNMEEVPE